MGRRSRSEIRGPGGALPLLPGDRAAQDLALLLEGETGTRPLGDVLRDFGCSRSSYYEKLQRFRDHGVSGLLPQPSGPRGPWRATPELVRLAVTARLAEPDRTAVSIAEALREQGVRASVRTVERTLASFGLTRRRGDAE
ncbi:MAG TPA: helix-turn-helix domain-containing protein [Myxococcales bacterium]|nr:helix-turn-helix domain-containing protein [Myxococcales bacterium]